MATNGNDGKMTFSDVGNINQGIGGYTQGQQLKRQFSNDFWKQGGYLSESIKELNTMSKLYEHLSKMSDTMAKKDQKAVEAKKLALKQQLSYLQDIQKSQEVSDKEAIEAIRSSNALLLKGQQKYIELLNEEQDIVEATGKSKEEAIDNAIKKQNRLNESTKKQNTELKNVAKLLGQATDDLSTSISKTIKSVGGELKELANMFNLQAIANNSMEQNARSKASIMSDVSKQFGFTSNSQFESFKDSLNDTLKDMNAEMGNIFNSSDLKQYMYSLSEFGITSTKMAEEQMKNSIIATKYLGASNETQTAIFKFMKLTNNNDMLNEYNKTIVGLLKSDLGVSKEQLDALTKMATADQDALMANGMSANTYKKYLQQYDTVGAVLKSKYGDSVANSIMGVVSELAQSSYNDADTLIRKYGASAVTAMRELQNTGNVLSVVEMLTGSAGSWGRVSGDATVNATYRDIIGADNASALTAFGMLSGDMGDVSKTTNDILSGLKDISDLDVQTYIQETTTTTALEKIQNWLDTFINGISWKTTMNLANAALVAYLAAKPFEIISFFKDMKLTSLLTKQLGAGSAMGKHAANTAGLATGAGTGGKALAALGMGAAVIGLTAGTISALGSYFAGKQDEAYNNQYAENMSSLKGTSLANNASMASAMTVASASNSMTGFGTEMGNTKSGISYGIAKLTTKDKDSLNKALTEWMYRAGVFTDTNYVLAWAYLMNQVDSLDAMNQAMGTNFSSASLYKIVSDKNFDNQSAWNHMASILKAGWHPYTDNNGGRIKDWRQAADIWDMTKYEGYHKNGKDYIPKDNYKALLHKGEMVLTAEEAAMYRQMMGTGGDSDKTPRGPGRIISGLPWIMTAGYPSYPSGGQHRGLDFGIPIGTKVGAAINGTIVKAYTGDNYNTYAEGRRVFGQYILMRGDNGLYYRYGHLSKVGVTNGQRVKAGDTIGLSGNTGYSTGPHLHWQVQKDTNNTSDISPYPYITSALFQAKGDIGLPSYSSSDTEGTEDGSIKVQAKKFIPKSFSNDIGGGEDSAGRVVNSVDGGFNKLISYLDSIREEQAAQREIINAFSKSRVAPPTFN